MYHTNKQRANRETRSTPQADAHHNLCHNHDNNKPRKPPQEMYTQQYARQHQN
jgi:hypothetical protein